MATRLANQIQTLVRAIPSFGEGPTFAESDELEFEPGTNRVFRHGESRQDLHSAVAHDLHMARNARAGLAVGVLTGTGVAASLSPFADHVIPGIEDLESLLDRISA